MLLRQSERSYQLSADFLLILHYCNLIRLLPSRMLSDMLTPVLEQGDTFRRILE